MHMLSGKLIPHTLIFLLGNVSIWEHEGFCQHSSARGEKISCQWKKGWGWLYSNAVLFIRKCQQLYYMTTSLPHHERLFCWMLLKYFQSFSPFRRATLVASAANADVTTTQGLAMSTDMLFLEHSKNGGNGNVQNQSCTVSRPANHFARHNNYRNAFVN